MVWYDDMGEPDSKNGQRVCSQSRHKAHLVP